MSDAAIAGEGRGLPALREAWAAAWPAAWRLWSPYARLRDPLLCLDDESAKAQGLEGIAMIRLDDKRVVINLAEVSRLGLGEEAASILAHEAGHHVLAPGDLLDFGRALARTRRTLPGLEALAPMALNLWMDIVINDRLRKEKGLRLERVYARIGPSSKGELWSLYLRSYEILWALPAGSLGGKVPEAAPPDGEAHDVYMPLEDDALTVASLAVSYGRDWLRGASRFAAVIFPYLTKDFVYEGMGATLDSLRPGDPGQVPAGLAERDEDDPATESEAQGEGQGGGSGGGAGQWREPFEYGQVLRAMGVELSAEEMAARYYKERAMPNLVPFPERRLPMKTEPLPEGWTNWEAGNPLERIDWQRSAALSPILVPGLTLVERVEGEQPGREPGRRPLDLDLYVDCSGSMPDPRSAVSYLTLAGAIVALSALRAGSRVRACLWSGTSEVKVTEGFTRDEAPILAVLTGYFGGGTAFPLHLLREGFRPRTPDSRDCHILCISDDGITTMLAVDEKGNAGAAVAAEALRRAGGGGTLVLNMAPSRVEERDFKALAGMGWDISIVSDWESLVAFARDFALERYGGKT